MRIFMLLGIVLAAYIRLIRCQNHGSVSDGTLVCFSCRGMTHLKYCNVVERCSETVGCYVEQFFIGSQPRYNSGCMTSTLTCDIILHQQPGICATCCNTSLCNSHGCGDRGFGSQDTRGPLCYECEYLGNPADCVTIQQCLSGQVCHIAEFQWGDNDYLYSMGCNSKIVCNSPASSLWTPNHAIIGRSAPTCSHCCEQDYCNLNCADPPHDQTTAKTAALTIVSNTTPSKMTFWKTHLTTAQPTITLLPVKPLTESTTQDATIIPYSMRIMTKPFSTKQSPITLPSVQPLTESTTQDATIIPYSMRIMTKPFSTKQSPITLPSVQPSKPITHTQSTQKTTNTTNRASVKSTTFITIRPVASKRPPITIPPVQHTCFTCGDSTRDTCEYQYEETQCNPPNNYCMNIVINSITGLRTVERKCASFDDCYSNWWQGSSDEELCQTYTPDVSLTANFQCNFCCIENKCNEDIKPNKSTLYQDN